MKKSVVCFMLVCVALAGCGGKKDSPKNLPKCDDEVVMQKLKDAVIKDFQAQCSKGSEWEEYCHAEKGVFEDFRYGGEDVDGKDFCMAHFSINKDEKGWWVSYYTKYENQEAVVTDIDALAY